MTSLFVRKGNDEYFLVWPWQERGVIGLVNKGGSAPLQCDSFSVSAYHAYFVGSVVGFLI